MSETDVTPRDGGDRTIGEAAELLGVSTRTLRHWDGIGLLRPAWRTSADYRLYTETDIERALTILVYRSAGLTLGEIADLLDEQARDSRVARLRRQRGVLLERSAHLTRMIAAVDRLLEEENDVKGDGERMTAEEKVALFGRDWPEWQEEARQRWGHTPEWAEAASRQRKMSRSDWEDAKAEMDSFRDALVDACDRGVEPGSAEADDLVLRHRASIDRYYAASPEKQVILARMYLSDDRFAPAYGDAATDPAGPDDAVSSGGAVRSDETESSDGAVRSGGAVRSDGAVRSGDSSADEAAPRAGARYRGYLRDIVEARAAVEGVDLDDVQWR